MSDYDRYLRRSKRVRLLEEFFERAKDLMICLGNKPRAHDLTQRLDDLTERINEIDELPGPHDSERGEPN